MKKAIWPAICALLLVAVYALGQKACRKPDAQYFIDRDTYNQAVAAAEATHKLDLEALAQRDKTIATKDAEISARDTTIAQLTTTQENQAQAGRDLKAENERLTKDAAAAISANPAVRALVDNFELRCSNYEKQIFTLTQTLAEERAARAAQAEKIVALAYQRDTWKKAFDDEHALRLAGDSLRLDLERRWDRSKFWTTVAKWATPVAAAAGFILGRL